MEHVSMICRTLACLLAVLFCGGCVHYGIESRETPPDQIPRHIAAHFERHFPDAEVFEVVEDTFKGRVVSYEIKYVQPGGQMGRVGIRHDGELIRYDQVEVYAGAESSEADWIYYRQYELYVYLIRFSELPGAQRNFFRTKSYEFFFQYWLLHRSIHAKICPVPDFEKQFSILLKNHVLANVEKNDPLSIQTYYKEGMFVPRPLPDELQGVEIPEALRLPQVDGLPGEELRTWEGYQRYVKEFLKFYGALMDGSTDGVANGSSETADK